MREPDAALDGSTPSDDRPAVARPASHVGVGETEQRLVAGRVGTHSGLGQDAADQAGAAAARVPRWVSTQVRSSSQAHVSEAALLLSHKVRDRRVQPVGSANRLMARKWAATPAMTKRWKTSW
jgi:hypothetical protein